MKLIPIRLNEDTTKGIFAAKEVQELFEIYRDYYPKVGFNVPWIGYFIVRKNQIVGCCGYVEKPKNGKVEIAYGTFKEFENQGIASFGCKKLILIAQKTDPTITIFAKTAPENNASTKILGRNGFKFTGIVQDHEIGDAWEWTLDF